jgi:hypothetical protein
MKLLDGSLDPEQIRKTMKTSIKTAITLSAICAALFSGANMTLAQEAPVFTTSDLVILTPQEWFTKEAALAINTTSPEILFTTIITSDTGSGLDLTDPITGQASGSVLAGYFYNPITMEPVGDPFVIVGNPNGDMQKHDVKYNPISNQYNVVVAAESRGSTAARVLLVALVNPSSVAGPENRIARAFAHDEDSSISYQDTALATSTQNGNFLIVAEYQVPDEGEAVAGMLFNRSGDLISPTVTRLDQLESTFDEDDPDVVYLPENDAFLFLTNTDPDSNPDVITGSIIGAAPDLEGNLVVGQQQILGQRRRELAQGHPSAVENPFNKEFIGAFDHSNGSDGGDLFYFNIGPAPDYILTEARPQIPYLEATGSSPYNQRHPQFAVDFNSGVIAMMTNPHGSADGHPNGLGFTFLGKDGAPLPGADVTGDYFHAFVRTIDPFDPENPGANPSISNDANYYNVKYDPFSDSFIATWTDASAFTFAVQVKVENEAAEGPIVDFEFNGNYNSATLYGSATLAGGTPDTAGDLPSFVDDSVTMTAGDQSLSFSGVGSNVAYWSDFGSWLNFDDQNYTLEAWVNIGDPNAAGEGLGKGIIVSYGLPGGYSMWITNENKLGGTTYGIADLFTDAVVPADGWHHVALVHESGVEVRFYIDGQLAQTLAETRGVNPTADNTLYVGFETTTGAAVLNPFNGMIDRVRITPEALTGETLDLEGLPVSAPMISITAQSDSMIELSWEDSDGLILEAATDPSGPWYAVQTLAENRTPFSISSQAEVALADGQDITALGAGKIFFRLRR